MRCPVCMSKSLFDTTIENGLSVSVCESCNGYWLAYDKYQAWRKDNSQSPSGTELTDIAHEPCDVKKAKMCPACGRILTKFKVGHGIDFYLDHCDGCNGVWLDSNEWNVLKKHNLHKAINDMFTSSWRRQIHVDDLRHSHDKIFTETFGISDYAELQKMKQWIDKHPKRTAIISFLIDDNPYK